MNLERIGLTLTFGILYTALAMCYYCEGLSFFYTVSVLSLMSSFTARPLHQITLRQHRALTECTKLFFLHQSRSFPIYFSLHLCLPSHSPFLLACLNLSLSLTMCRGVQGGEELAVHRTLGHMARPRCEEEMLVRCFREVANCDSQGHCTWGTAKFLKDEEVN